MKLKNWIIEIYLFMMLGIFPLFYRNKYFDMGEAKYDFFLYTTIVMLISLMLAVVVSLDKSAFVKKRDVISWLDWTVLIYILITAVSWLISPYKRETWLGSQEWHMGLLSQLLFAGIYFAVSRCFSVKKWIVSSTIVSAGTVFLIAYLHRFQIDPLGLYEGVSLKNQMEFLGTIGQATWYSSYISVILPIFMAWYIFSLKEGNNSEKIKRSAMAAVLFLGFATAVTQNSDSIYIGLGCALLFLLWFALENIAYWKRYLEILLIGLLAAKFTGILQNAFPEQVPKLGKISIAVTQGGWGWYALAIAVGVYLFSRQMEWKYKKSSKDICRLKKLVRQGRTLFYILLAIGAALIPILIWLVTTEKIHIDGGILKDSGYLVFNDRWGNRRGKNWKYAVKLFQEYSIPGKLFGCGPDGMSFYSEMFHYEEMRQMWKDTIVTNAHNEWLTALVNGGILGAISYLSIFIVAISNVCKNWRKNPMLLAAGASVAAYMGHNFFCYQQCVCTPLIFIVIGAVTYYTKKYEVDICQNVKHMLK